MFGTSKNSNNNTFQVDSSSNNAFNFSFGSGDVDGGDTSRRTGFDADNTTSQKDETTASVAATGQGNAQTGQMNKGGDTESFYQPQQSQFNPFNAPEASKNNNTMLYAIGGGVGFLGIMGVIIALIMKK